VKTSEELRSEYLAGLEVGSLASVTTRTWNSDAKVYVRFYEWAEIIDIESSWITLADKSNYHREGGQGSWQNLKLNYLSTPEIENAIETEVAERQERMELSDRVFHLLQHDEPWISNADLAAIEKFLLTAKARFDGASDSSDLLTP
jgi:hypothetical protein